MKIGIMQPYLFPYIGYWQLINTVDKFVIYDNIQFTKNGWIKRNRILLDGKEKIISIPIKKDSDYLDINKRLISESFSKEKEKIINQIKTSYSKAPQFEIVFPIIESTLNYENENLFDFLFQSIKEVVNYLEIKTELIISSSIEMDHSLKKSNRVIEICNNLKANEYINPIGGVDLYDRKEFKSQGIDLSFLKSNLIEYRQFNGKFVPNLSIIDVLMFNSKENIRDMLNEFVLI